MILVLYGGRVASDEPSRWWHLSALRLRPVARSLHRWGVGRGVAVVTLQYGVRGWNAPHESPVADARWALARIRDRYGEVPVCLVGHSMGGRTALRVAADRCVVGVLALAPWLPQGEPVPALAGREVLVLHGTADRWTDPAGSRAYVEAARSCGAPDAAWVPVRGAGHFMFARPLIWRSRRSAFVSRVLGGATQRSDGSSEARSR